MKVPSISQYRKIHLRLSKMLRGLSFNFLHLPLSRRLTLAGEIIIFLSFFFPFVSLANGADFWAFSRFFFIGSAIILISGLLAVLWALSSLPQEIIRSIFKVPFSDAAFISSIGSIQLTAVLCNIQFLSALSYFTKEVLYGDALAYALAWSIIIMIAGYFGFREEKKRILTTLYIENNQTTSAQFEEYRDLLSKDAGKKNMSLPI